MEYIPIYKYMVYYSANPVGIKVFNENKEVLGEFLGTDITDGTIFVYDGQTYNNEDPKKCFVELTIN